MTKSRGKPLTDEVLRILHGSPMGMNDRFSVARIIETERGAKRGSYHLAVNRAMRVLERQGKVVVWAPRDQWDSQHMALVGEEKRKALEAGEGGDRRPPE